MSIEALRLPTSHSETVQALNDHACGLREAKCYETALIALRRALALDPMQHAVWGNLGCVLWNMGRYQEAEEPLRRATFLAPSHGPHWGNLGLLYSSLKRNDEAADCFDKCVAHAINEQHRQGAIWDRSLMRLRAGDWARGCEDYEVRIPLRGPDLYPKMPVPTWQGEPLDGKTLYVQAEQGIGDRILFSRYFQVIKDRWPTCRILACVNERLLDLLWEFRHIVEFLPTGVPWPDDIDYGVFQASLVRWLSPDIGSVPPDPGLILKRVRTAQAKGTFKPPKPNQNLFQIGVAWTGNPEMQRNADRSIPLQKLLALAEDPRLCLYGFQVGPGEEQIGQLGAHELICNLGPDLAKLGPVAAGAAMLEMDLIITSCTATAHLAGALGVPCWTLLCTDAYWVWLDDRSDCVWYPDTRLFRQSVPGDWDPVLAEVRAELTKPCDAFDDEANDLGEIVHG